MNSASSARSGRSLRWVLLATTLITSLSIAAEVVDTSLVTDTKRRHLHAHVTASIRASLPAYTPPPPGTKTPITDDIASVVLLDPMTVSDKRPPSATEWEMLSESGRAELLKKKYRGSTPPGDALNRNVPNYALLRFRDDKRLQDLKGMNDLAEIARLTGDLTGAKRLKKEMRRVLIRQNDWLTESMDRSYNNNRR